LIFAAGSAGSVTAIAPPLDGSAIAIVLARPPARRLGYRHRIRTTATPP
jgi:hypothetical protein